MAFVSGCRDFYSAAMMKNSAALDGGHDQQDQADDDHEHSLVVRPVATRGTGGLLTGVPVRRPDRRGGHAGCQRSAWSAQRSLPRPPSLSVMLPGSMPYLESIPACWALSVSTLSGSSLLAWLAWSSLPWLRSSCRIWSLSIFISGLLSISAMRISGWC